MTVFVILASFVVLVSFALPRDWLAVARVGVGLPLPLKTPVPRINVQTVLGAVARVPTSASIVPTPIFVPPLESADPLWDRELDEGRG